MRQFALLLFPVGLASCASAPSRAPGYAVESSSSFPAGELSTAAPVEPRGQQDPFAPPKPKTPGRPEWHRGQALMQGFFGVSEFDEVERSGGVNPDVDGDEGDLETMPVLGGGAQFKLGGERVDYGLEGLFGFGGRANASAFAVGGGGVAIAVDVDLLIFDLYGGPFVSMFLGEKLRVYAGAGPVLEWADYEQSSNGFDDDGSGFGYGTYARTGIELVLPSGTMLGFGVRWSDTTVDLDGGLGDLEMDGFQMMLTVSRGL